MTAKTAAQLKAEFQGTDPQDFANDVADSMVVEASATAKGIVELATDAETQTGTDATRAVTPAALSARTASATRTGVVELASDAEAKAGTDTARAVTPGNLAAVLTNLRVMTFTGKNGTGACTLTGAVAGDRVLGIACIDTASLGVGDANFEAVITVGDQIQQTSASDLSTKHYLAILNPIA